MRIRPVADTAMTVALDGGSPVATRSNPIDVPDDIARGLIAGGLWEKAPAPRGPRAAKTPADKPPASPTGDTDPDTKEPTDGTA